MGNRRVFHSSQSTRNGCGSSFLGENGIMGTVDGYDDGARPGIWLE
jgi:hypothetical protein